MLGTKLLLLGVADSACGSCQLIVRTFRVTDVVVTSIVSKSIVTISESRCHTSVSYLGTAPALSMIDSIGNL